MSRVSPAETDAGATAVVNRAAGELQLEVAAANRISGGQRGHGLPGARHNANRSKRTARWMKSNTKCGGGRVAQSLRFTPS